jgi:hypothetical protein
MLAARRQRRFPPHGRCASPLRLPKRVDHLNAADWFGSMHGLRQVVPRSRRETSTRVSRARRARAPSSSVGARRRLQRCRLSKPRRRRPQWSASRSRSVCCSADCWPHSPSGAIRLNLAISSMYWHRRRLAIARTSLPSGRTARSGAAVRDSPRAFQGFGWFECLGLAVCFVETLT